MSQGYNIRKWLAEQRGNGERKILEWQKQLRNDQEGLYYVTLQKYDIVFKFDPRWNELLKAKHQTEDSYGLFGDDAGLFYDVNRKVIQSLGGKFVVKDGGVHLNKHIASMIFEAVDAFVQARKEVLDGQRPKEDYLPIGTVIGDKPNITASR